MQGVGVGVGLVTASERIYLGVKLLKDVYNQFGCEIRSHSVLELTINKISTHFMSLFALFALQKSVNKSANKSANIRTIRSHPLLKCEQLFALQFCARMETLFQRPKYEPKSLKTAHKKWHSAKNFRNRFFIA